MPDASDPTAKSSSAPGRKPVPPSVAKLTVKQQREAQRAEKVAAYKREQARKTRNRRIGIGAGIGGGVIVVGAVVAVIVASMIPRAPVVIADLQEFDNTSDHVTGTVDYPQDPPAGGPHNAAWLNCGVYDQPVPNENAVHSLEHGAIWVTYDPELPADDLSALRSQLPDTYTIVSPYPGLTSPIVLSGWNRQVAVDGADDPRIGEFVSEYWRAGDVPEPGASCTGAIDGAGKVA